MISLSTQIIGEKPQTASGPLWAIDHLRVMLTLMMVSHAVKRMIYTAGFCLMGLQCWGQVGEGGLSDHCPPPTSLPSRQPRARLAGERLHFLLGLSGPNAGWGAGMERVLSDLQAKQYRAQSHLSTTCVLRPF